MDLVGSAHARAEVPRQQGRAERHPESEQQSLAPVREQRAVRCRHVGEVEVEFRGSAQARDQRADVEPGADEARERERRHEQGKGVQERLHARVPGLDAKPIVQSEAQVSPDQEQEKRLTHRGPGIRPEHPDHPHVRNLVAEELPREARADDVPDEQRRNGEAQGELQRLPRRHAQRRAPVQRRQRQREVRDERPVEQDRSRGTPPQQDESSAQPVHCVDRNHAQRVIEEMRDDEAGDRQPGRQAQVSL